MSFLSEKEVKEYTYLPEREVMLREARRNSAKISILVGQCIL